MTLKKRILIVEDEEDIRLLIKVTLSASYEVFEAANGLDALSRLEHIQPDLIISDIMMPIMNGYELCQAVRTMPHIARTLPFIFLSALSNREDMMKGYELGASQYITKPFTPTRLLKLVAMQLTENPSAPIVKTQPQKVAPTPAPPAPKTKLPRVLAIDDNEDFIAMLRTWFGNSSQYEFCWAFDGAQAIDRIVRYRPDIVLLDLMLPKMSGYQVLQLLKQNKQYRDLPVILLSGKNQDKDREYGLNMGACDFLDKPVTLDVLIDALDRVINAPGFTILPKQSDYDMIRTQDSIKTDDPFVTGKHDFHKLNHHRLD